MNTIPWYQSKIVWLNVVLTLIGAGSLVADALAKDANMTAPGIIMVGVGVLGVILRIWFTDTVIQTAKNPGPVVFNAGGPVNPEVPGK